MPSKKTLSLSKRFVFAVLALACVIMMASSLLTFSSSRKLAGTLAGLSEIQQLTNELASMPLRLESLLNHARAYARSGKPEDLAPLKASLAEWRVWDPPPPHRHNHPMIDEIEQLANRVNGQLQTMVVLGENNQHRRAAKLWMDIESEMPGQKLQTLTTKLTSVVREDFNIQARLGSDVAEAYQYTSLGFVGLAMVLGLLCAILLGRRMRELETIITVCAWTKQVKHGDRWVPIEEFLEQRFQLQLSHGISDDAARQELEQLAQSRTIP